MSKITDFKETLLNTGVFKRVKQEQYVCKYCPYCGDSKSHFYVKITMDDSPIVYNCFKCCAHGVLNSKFISFYNIENVSMPRFRSMKRIETEGVNNTIIDLIHDNDDIEDIMKYIEKRVGVYPDIEDLKCFQYIGHPYKYAIDYLTAKRLSNKWFDKENKRYWFKLSNGNMIGRDESESDGWRRFKSDRIKSSGIYIIKKPFDPSKPITIYICEGIMDAIGLYYHFPIMNGVYISVLGRDYMKGINHLINMGIFGEHISIKIMKDADVDKVRYDGYAISLFKHVEVYQNMIGKDFGMHKCDIDIQRVDVL